MENARPHGGSAGAYLRPYDSNRPPGAADPVAQEDAHSVCRSREILARKMGQSDTPFSIEFALRHFSQGSALERGKQKVRTGAGVRGAEKVRTDSRLGIGRVAEGSPCSVRISAAAPETMTLQGGRRRSSNEQCSSEPESQVMWRTRSTIPSGQSSRCSFLDRAREPRRVLQVSHHQGCTKARTGIHCSAAVECRAARTPAFQ